MNTIHPNTIKLNLSNFANFFIAPADFNLLLLFINAPEHFLTKEDIKNVFWPQEDKPDNKIHNHISTLKSSIKNFSEYQIITEPKKGYRLVISSNG